MPFNDEWDEKMKSKYFWKVTVAYFKATFLHLPGRIDKN
jgi:hypothetical protein